MTPQEFRELTQEVQAAFDAAAKARAEGDLFAEATYRARGQVLAERALAGAATINPTA